MQGLSRDLRSVYWLVSVSVFSIFCFLIYLWRDFRVDDAYITYRYAANVAEGFGPVFNVGQCVEGYTSFLWMVILSFFSMKGLDLLAVSRLLSVLSSGIIVWLMVKFMSLVQKQSPIGLFAPGLLLTSFPFIIYVESGLETVFFTAIVFGGTYLVAIAGLRKSLSLYFLSGILWGLGSLTRPEALALGPLCLLCAELLTISAMDSQRCIGRSTDDGKYRLIRYIYFSVGYSILVIPHLLWRWKYYGQILPNTYFAKVETLSLLSRLSRGLIYVRDSIRETPILPLLISSWIVAPKSLWRQAGWRMLATLSVVLLAVVLFEGGDWMPGHRFLVPLLPFAFSLITLAILARWEDIQAMHRKRYTGSPLALTALGVTIILLNVVPHYTENERIQDYIQNLNHREQMAAWLVKEIPKEFVIAYGDMGIVPYTMRRNSFIDLNGLTDRFVARSNKTEVAKYVLSQRPEVIIMIALDQEHPIERSDDVHAFGPSYQALADSEELWSEYSFARSFPSFDRDSAWLRRARAPLLFVRRDISPLMSMPGCGGDLSYPTNVPMSN